MITYKRADSDEELNQILDLQRSNFSSAISHEEKEIEGFVTVKHNFDLLKEMNDKCAHIIAKKDTRVVGYALCMLKEFESRIALLKPMFGHIDAHISKKETYIVMGQVCIDKSFRRKGIFRGLYRFMKNELHSKFDLMITEVDVANTRSLHAHYAIGFKLLHSYNSSNQDWALISWDWS